MGGDLSSTVAALMPDFETVRNSLQPPVRGGGVTINAAATIVVCIPLPSVASFILVIFFSHMTHISFHMTRLLLHHRARRSFQVTCSSARILVPRSSWRNPILSLVKLARSWASVGVPLVMRRRLTGRNKVRGGGEVTHRVCHFHLSVSLCIS